MKGMNRQTPFILINYDVVFDSWAQNVLQGLCTLILKYGARRFSMIPKFQVIPYYPVTETVFTVLGAEGFD